MEKLLESFEVTDKVFAHLLIMDADFHVLHIKPSTAAALGYQADELKNKTLEDVLIEKNVPRVRWAFRESEKEGNEFVYERVYFKKKNGKPFRLDFTLFNIIKGGKKIYVGVGVRKKSPAQIIASSRKKRNQELMALYNVGKIMEEPSFGNEDLISISSIISRAMLHPQVARTRIVFDDHEYSALPLPAKYSSNRIISDLVVSGEKRGFIEIVYTKESAQFIPEESEMLSEVAKIISRVIERNEMARRLEESSVRHKTLFDAITDLIYETDIDRNIRMVNKKRAGVKEGKCYEKLRYLNEPCKECLISQVVRTKKHAQVEVKVDNRVVLLSTYPILDAGNNVTSLLHIVREITKERNLEQQLIQSDRLASLGQLVSGIAHEINNPNTFIRGNIEIISEAMETMLPILDAYAAEHPELTVARLPYKFFRQNITTLVADMQKGADRIKNIVADLRKFARRDEGRLDEDVDINNVIESSLRLVHNQVKRIANVQLNLGEALPIIKGNIQKLEQVVVNMIINASHAIEERKGREMGTITISTFLRDNRSICLKIKDDGTGMTDEVRKKIFDPFFTTKKARQGTGLGLSIVYGIIEEHQGSIQVESWPDKGSEFTIMLPLGTVEGKKEDRPAITHA